MVKSIGMNGVFLGLAGLLLVISQNHLENAEQIADNGIFEEGKKLNKKKH